MIISHKEFPNFRRYEMDYCGRPFFMEIGKMAELCNASVLVGYGDTRVLVTATASARPKDGIDYFRLSTPYSRAVSLTARCARSSRPICATTLSSPAKCSPWTATAPPRSPQ